VPLLLLAAGLVRAEAPGDKTLAQLKQKSAEYKNPSVNDLLKGTEKANPQSQHHKDALESEARMMAFRIYLDDAQLPDIPTDRDSIHKIFVDYERDINLLADKNKRETLPPARMLFTHSVLEMCKEVIAAEVKRRPAPRPLVLMNAVRMMAGTAKLGQPETADALIDVLLKPPAGNQGAQYWAARGLRELLEKYIEQESRPAEEKQLERLPEILDDAHLAKVADALAEFVDRKVPFAIGAPQQEIDGYRSLRREAIRALALTGVAAGPKGKPAWVLVKVMSSHDMSPRPRMDERAEAAIGVARMRAKNSNDYRPEYAAQQMVAFVRDFAIFVQTDYRNGDKSGLPCRVLAARLRDSLNELKTPIEAKLTGLDEKNWPKEDAYLVKAIDEAVKTLEAIETNGPVSSDSLRQWLADKKNASPSPTLFKSDANTAVVRKWFLP
jgi:hypothetical protein